MISDMGEIKDRLDKFDTKLDLILSEVKEHSFEIKEIKKDLYQNNGQKCLFTRVEDLEKEQTSTNKKIAWCGGFAACIGTIVNKIF